MYFDVMRYSDNFKNLPGIDGSKKCSLKKLAEKKLTLCLIENGHLH